MSASKSIPLILFKLGCGYGSSSFVSPFGIYLVGGELEGKSACAVYSLGKVIVGDKIYVRIPEEYGEPQYWVYSLSKRKGLSDGPRVAPVHVEGDLWVVTVTEADDEGAIILYGYPDSPPKMYTAVGFNVKPLPTRLKAVIGVMPSMIIGSLLTMWSLS